MLIMVDFRYGELTIAPENWMIWRIKNDFGYMQVNQHKKILSGHTMKEGSRRQNSETARKGIGMEETNQQSTQQQKEFEKYVKQVTPTHNLWLQMLKAFITGGVICCIGQFILNYAESMGLDKQTAGSWCSLILVLGSVILTGFGIYPKIVKWGGAGALVPITGFANSVAAPAIEYKSEGQVFGIGCKIFTIAGPVILYGIFASWLLGLGYWIGMMLGWTVT